MEDRKILIGSKAICMHLGISRTTLHRLMKAGLPVRNVNNCLCAHTDRLDEFFKVLIPSGSGHEFKKRLNKLNKSSDSGKR